MNNQYKTIHSIMASSLFLFLSCRGVKFLCRGWFDLGRGVGQWLKGERSPCNCESRLLWRRRGLARDAPPSSTSPVQDGVTELLCPHLEWNANRMHIAHVSIDWTLHLTVSERKFSILLWMKGNLRMALTEGLSLGWCLRQVSTRERRSREYLVDMAG